MTPPDRIIALCCDVPGADRWDLVNREFNDAIRDEIRTRTLALAVQSSDAAAQP